MHTLTLPDNLRIKRREPEQHPSKKTQDKDKKNKTKHNTHTHTVPTRTTQHKHQMNKIHCIADYRTVRRRLDFLSFRLIYMNTAPPPPTEVDDDDDDPTTKMRA